MLCVPTPPYHSQVLDHSVLFDGLFDELGIGDVIAQATQQDPQTRDLTAGEAVKAMVLNGLGFVMIRHAEGYFQRSCHVPWDTTTHENDFSLPYHQAEG
jgi:Domain of unknown function (DUF4277)